MSLQTVRDFFSSRNLDLPIIELSSKTGDGVDQWIEWLLGCVAERKLDVQPG